MTAVIQIFLDGAWHDAATLQIHDANQGYAGGCSFAYLIDHFARYAVQPHPTAAVSCRYPVNYEIHDLDSWPAFLLDVLPSGAGRVHWLTHLGLKDGPAADWELLQNGTGNPPGNLRIAEAAVRRDVIVPTADGKLVSNHGHPGFQREDILDRQEHFIEYAAQMGAHVAGCSDVQGVAPKFLLQQDHRGRWHAEGALADADVSACWIVKFPRGKTEQDRTVLRNEAPYMALAGSIGLKVYPVATEWEGDALFVPRFDRQIIPGGVVRFGMESLYSLAGITGYGVSVSQNVFAKALADYSTDPEVELREFVRRDVFNIAVGNKDNHGRNTAVLRLPDGTVTLTPLFDVAPMYLDPEGIARVSRWEGDAEAGGRPLWGRVAEALQIKDHRAFRGELADWADTIERLPDQMRECGVQDSIIENRAVGIKDLAQELRDAAPTFTARVRPNKQSGFEP